MGDMDLAFYKLHSTGGDYLLSNFIHGPDPEMDFFPELARVICKRRTGVGANGLLAMTRGVEHSIRLHYFPARLEDTRKIPGDALACAGRYAFNLGLARNAQISAESDFGVVTIEVIDSTNFRVDLGIPTHPETGEEISPAASTDIIETARAAGRRQPFAPIALGRKHAVVTTERSPKAIRQLAKLLSESGDLSDYQPVFMRSISHEECTGYCWATNSTPDHAESMGACAVVGILHGFCDNEVTVRFRSYLLHAQWQRSDGRLYVTAPTEYICSGSFSVEDDVLERMSRMMN
jgi:diaminopimelate epimerase